jgi:hypothetical protein
MCGIKSEGWVRLVRLRVCGDGSPGRVSASGCWWGTDGIGQEQLGPWWCKRRETELERLALRESKYLTCDANVLNAPGAPPSR